MDTPSTGVPMGTCVTHGWHGMTSCPHCSSAVGPFTPLQPSDRRKRMSDTYVPPRTHIDWVLDDLTEDGLPLLHRVTLTKPANRDDWFDWMLAELDWEIQGGTWEQPLWAFTKHPWFAQLGVTVEECEDHLRGGGK